MAIVRNSFRVPRLGADIRPANRGSVSDSDDGGDLPMNSSASSETDDDGGGDSEASVSDEDSGMESDEFDPSELGDPGTELCQVGSESCSIPLELYDLPDLTSVLSLETWNECLSESDRFVLAEFLPDMDHETFAHTLKELFSGANFHFNRPIADIFTRLKGGVCDPRVVLYRRGLNFFQRRRHYHLLRKYQNSMVGGLVQIRSVLQGFAGYGVEERLRLLNMVGSKRPQSYGRDRSIRAESDSESGDSGDRFWSERLKMGRRVLPPSKHSFGAALRVGGKDNKKSILPVSDKQYPFSIKHGVQKKCGPPLPPLHHSRQELSIGIGRQPRNQMRGDDDNYEEHGSEMGVQGEWNSSRGRTPVRASLLNPVRKSEPLKGYEREVIHRFVGEDSKDFARPSRYQGRSRNADQVVTVASYDPPSIGALKKMEYSQRDLMYPAKDLIQYQGMKGDHVDRSGGLFKSGKSKIGTDSKLRSYNSFPAQIGSSYLRSDHKTKPSIENNRIKSAENEGMAMEHSRGNSMFVRSEETESDSSDQVEGDGNINPMGRKMRYPSAAMGLVVVNSVHDTKKPNKLAKLDKQVYSHLVDGGTSIHTPTVEPYPTKGKQKGKANEPNYLHDSKLMKKGQVSHSIGKTQASFLSTYATERERKDCSPQQSNYMGDNDRGILDENEERLHWNSKLAGGQMQSDRPGNKGQVSVFHTTATGHHEMRDLPLLGCSTMAKNQKGKMDGKFLGEPDGSVRQQSSFTKQGDDQDLMKKKGKRKADGGTGLTVVTPERLMSEQGTADIELETKAQKKPFTPITPSIHTGFSFSIIHLLSAVRKAMTTTQIDETIGVGNHCEKDGGKPNISSEEQNKMLHVGSDQRPSHFLEKLDINTPEPIGQNNLPSLTVQEIISRVRSNPGDPCILETQEPLQDLVRGVLKIFSSKTAPLGAKGWKALVFYDKLNKRWTWVGPVSSSSSENDIVDEETSSEGWFIPHKMLVKLVDAFANWLKCGQETLQQIGSLPAPPVVMLLNLDEKERFKDLRAQKSLNTINPSSDELRAYFRREELLRYSVPDRAFSYTAADGKKSIVAPLRRGGGKPTSKARDHFMLKSDRPPHVTILCLVRDAASRLPGSIGTRADVCTLIRDSQYIVEEVSDAQVNQVVSGALDRLHYERDPCVQFDGERKLWVYLHRDREEEDFEDDGTSSTKKWKRQKKDAVDYSDTGAGNDVSYHGIGDPGAIGSAARFDLHPDLNVDSFSVHAGDKTELIYNGLRSNMENIQSYIDSAQGDRTQGKPVSWEGNRLNPLRENKILCQENSTNDDFDEEAFSRERPVGLLSASLS